MTDNKLRIVVYTDNNADNALSLLKRAINTLFPDTTPTVLTTVSGITNMLWLDDAPPALHIVLATVMSADFVMLANKLTVKHGIKSVLFAAYDLTESSYIHLEESALWPYVRFCDHPKSIRGLCMSLSALELPKTMAATTI